MQNQDHYAEHTINEQSTPHFGISYHFLRFFISLFSFYFIVLFYFYLFFILFCFVFIRFLNAWKIEVSSDRVPLSFNYIPNRLWAQQAFEEREHEVRSKSGKVGCPDLRFAFPTKLRTNYVFYSFYNMQCFFPKNVFLCVFCPFWNSKRLQKIRHKCKKLFMQNFAKAEVYFCLDHDTLAFMSPLKQYRTPGRSPGCPWTHGHNNMNTKQF